VPKVSRDTVTSSTVSQPCGEHVIASAEGHSGALNRCGLVLNSLSCAVAKGVLPAGLRTSVQHGSASLR
jgi:hypothetical protein